QGRSHALEHLKRNDPVHDSLLQIVKRGARAEALRDLVRAGRERVKRREESRAARRQHRHGRVQAAGHHGCGERRACRLADRISPSRMHTVPVTAELSNAEFLHRHVLARQPVVIQGALAEWKALHWNVEYLERKVGSRHVRYRTEGEPVTGRFGELVERIFYGDPSAPYLRNIDLAEQLPELVDDIQPQPIYTRRNWRSHTLMPS